MSRYHTPNITMSALNLQFENVFNIATMSLRINCSHPAATRNKLWLMRFIISMLLSSTSSFFLTNSIFFHDIPNKKYIDASKNGTMAIVAYTITLKYFLLLYYQKSINVLIGHIDSDYKLAEEFSDEEKEVIAKYSKKGVTVCKFWLVCGFMTSVIFPAKAFVLMSYYCWKGDCKLIPMFNLTYPVPFETYKDLWPVFIGLFIFCLLFDCYAMTVYIGFDPLVPIFLLHTCGQLDLLSQRVIKLFSEVDNPRAIEENLKIIVLKLQELYSFVDCINNNFMVLYEYSMKATTFVLPLTAFQIVEDLGRGSVNIEFISFFSGCILHFYMPCYYSDLLMTKSERFRQALYSCGWEKQPDKGVRQMLLFMMTRATLPLGITTIFNPICLDTFAEMCRQSYAIFNLMGAAWT